MKWKKLLLPGFGGALVGLAAVMTRRRRKRRRLGAPYRIPEDIQSLRIETEPTSGLYRGNPYRSRVVYTCKPTQFRVWSLLDEPATEDGPGGSPIYWVSPVVEFYSESEAEPEQLAEERFYATIHYLPEGRVRALPGYVARFVPVQFHKCHVGGSMNGVETGEKIVTAPVTDFEIF